MVTHPYSSSASHGAGPSRPHTPRGLPNHSPASMIAADDEPLDIMPTRAGRKLCVRHKQMANQDVSLKLQRSLDNLPTSERSNITHLWSTFSNAPHSKRKLILEGILTMCCFSQLSHLSDSLNLLIRIDPFSLLPREVNLRILGYLDAISLGRAAQVSKSWKALADDDLLWRRMCGQHIDRKCEKCGWGLPLLERRRLRGELNEGSPAVAVGVGRHEHHDHTHGDGHAGGEAVASRAETLGTAGPSRSGHPPTGATGPTSESGFCETGFGGLGVKRSSEDGLAALPMSKAVFGVASPAVKRVKIDAPSDSESESLDGDAGRGAGKGKSRARMDDAARRGANGRLDDTAGGEGAGSGASLSREIRLTRPWKSVYCERLVVERNWRKGRCKMTTLKGHEDGIMCLQYHTSLTAPSHPVLITGSYDKTVRIWNLDTGECLRILRGHTRAVRALQFDQRLLFTGAMDGTVRIWNWRAGECLRVLEGHSDGVVSLSYNGYLLASGSKDATINIWNFRTGAKFTLRGHEEWVNGVMLWDGKTNPGDLDPAQMPSFASLSKRSQSPVRGGGPSPGGMSTIGMHGTSIPILHHTQSTPFLHPSSPNLSTAPPAPGTGPAPPSIEAGTMLFSCSDDQTIKLWDLTTRECVRTFSGHKAGVQGLKVIMVDMTDAEIAQRWRMRSATPPSGPSGPSAWGSAALAGPTPAGGVAAEGRLVDVPEGFDPHVHTRRGRAEAIEPKVFVHDSSASSSSISTAAAAAAAAAATEDAGDIDIDMDDTTTVTTTTTTVNGEDDAQAGTNKRRAVLLSASLDGTIKIWDVATGQEEKTLFGHIEGVWGVDMDALRIASASHDRTVKVWDRQSGNCVQTLVGHRGSVTSLQLSDDMIVSGSDDGDVMVWSFAPGAEAFGKDKAGVKK